MVVPIDTNPKQDSKRTEIPGSALAVARPSPLSFVLGQALVLGSEVSQPVSFPFVTSIYSPPYTLPSFPAEFLPQEVANAGHCSDENDPPNNQSFCSKEFGGRFRSVYHLFFSSQFGFIEAHGYPILRYSIELRRTAVHCFTTR